MNINPADDRMTGRERNRPGAVTDDSPWPAISVITVFYNPGPLLEQTIENVLGQRYPNLDYVLVNDASTDGSERIVEKYREHIQYWESERNEGIYGAMNRGMKLARGEWLNFLNCGDVFSSESVLSEVAGQIKNLPETDFIYGKFRMVDPKAGIQSIRGGRVGRRDLYFQTAICHQTVFTRKSLFGEIGPYDAAMKIAADYEWFVKYYSRADIHPLFIDRVLVDFLMDGASFRQRPVGLKERLAIVRRNFPPAVYALNLLSYAAKLTRVKIAQRFYGNFLFQQYRKIKYRGRSS